MTSSPMDPSPPSPRAALTDEDRTTLEGRLAVLRERLAEYERFDQRNMASLTRDDICWIELKLGIDHPSQPLIPIREAAAVREREIRREGIIENLVSGFDQLIRHEMDYAGPRKYQEVIKLCTDADRVRRYGSRDVGGYTDELQPMMLPRGDLLYGGDGGLVDNVRPIARPTPLQDMTRVLSEYLDKAHELTKARDDKLDAQLKQGEIQLKLSLYERTAQLGSLLDIRETLSKSPSMTGDRSTQLLILDNQINLAIAALEQQKETPHDPNADRTDPPADPDVVLPVLLRGHPPGVDGGGSLRSGDDAADAPGDRGDREAVGDRDQERLVPRRDFGAYINYRFPPGADREGGEGAREAVAAGADVDHGGPVR